MNNSKGFTLIELLVVIAIIGILSTIAMTSLNGARKKAADASFKSSVSSLQAIGVLCCDAGSTLIGGVTATEVLINGGTGVNVCTNVTSVPGQYPKNAIGDVTIGAVCSAGDFQINVAVPANFSGTLPAGHCDATHCWYTAT